MSMSQSTLTLWRVTFGVLGFGLAAMIIWASFSADIAQSFGDIVADPWGAVAMADLYLGFFIFGAFLFLIDGVKPSSFVWVAALMVLGNVLAIVWLVLRLPMLAARLQS
jgi:predicted membrane-bound dolichyl-phosphate-mannose-protein mannosyltransferase